MGWKNSLAGWRTSWLLFGALLLFVALRGAASAPKLNDFFVFHWAGEETAARSTILYVEPSPAKQRHYLYSPTSLLPMAALAFAPYQAAALLLCALRAASVGLLLWGVAKWSEEEGRAVDWRVAGWLAISSFVVCVRPTLNDAGNGQMNIVLLAMAFGGAWLASKPPRVSGWAGGALIGVAAAVKTLPLLFIGGPLFRWRWRAVAACVIVPLAATVWALIWFGPETTWTQWTEWSARTGRSAASRIDKDRVTSIPEFGLNVAVMAAGALAGEGEDAPAIDPRLAQRLWLAETALLAFLFLAIRWWRLRSGRGATPLWDACMAALGVVLVTPVARKAHATAALPAVMLALTLLSRRGFATIPKLEALFLAAIAVLFLTGDDIPLQKLIPGFEPNPSQLLALASLAGWLALQPLTPRDSAGAVAAESKDGGTSQ